MQVPTVLDRSQTCKKNFYKSSQFVLVATYTLDTPIHRSNVNTTNNSLDVTYFFHLLQVHQHYQVVHSRLHHLLTRLDHLYHLHPELQGDLKKIVAGLHGGKYETKMNTFLIHG